MQFKTAGIGVHNGILRHIGIVDNPITAGAHCIYLERDICSRLDRYNRDDDITDVWIWAVEIGNGCYDLYIGYA